MSPDEASLSVGKLIQTLKQEGFFQKNKRVTLFTDNIHQLKNFAVGEELLNHEIRNWLVWGAARPGELSNLLKNKDNP